MKRQLFFISLFLLSFLLPNLCAEDNRYYVAGRDIQSVYEHFTGISLKDAIENLLVKKYGPPNDSANVLVRFNGGGANNCLYIGGKNTLEILVRNKTRVSAMTLGFQFSCSVGSYKWAKDYGDITPNNSPVPNCLKIHPAAFGKDSTWMPNATAWHYPDSVLIGGYIMHPFDYILPPHDTEVVLYSMQIELPNDNAMIGGEFCVDNIFLPPAGGWIFTDAAKSRSLVPGFQNRPSNSSSDPSAPQCCFPITEHGSSPGSKSSDPNIIFLGDDEVIIPEPEMDFDNFPGIGLDDQGNRILGATLFFKGSEDDLKGLEAVGVQINPFHTGDYYNVRFPLSMMPKICQIKSVLRIRSQPKYEPQLK